MRLCAVTLERRHVGVDRRCRESEGKVKIEGYMSVSDEEAHQRLHKCLPIALLDPLSSPACITPATPYQHFGHCQDMAYPSSHAEGPSAIPPAEPLNQFDIVPLWH